MIKFSIVIPCYNSANYITNCIEHLLNLSFDKNSFEVIFIDDCSTDDTADIIITKTKNTGLTTRLIKNDRNYGPGRSRQIAAEKANGVYLCFCDSDDWYEPNVLSDLIREIIKNENDIVFFDMSYILNGKKHRKNFTTQFKYGEKLSYLSNCGESLCNLTVKRSLFLSTPTIDIRNGEDLALVPLLITKATKITHIDKSYYNYLMRSDSASLRTPHKHAYNNMLKSFKHITDNITIENEEIDKCVEFIGIKTILYNATLMSFKGGNNNKVISDILLNFNKEYPFWLKNTYLIQLSRFKIIYLWFLKHRMWFACRCYTKLHSYLLT